MFNRVLNAPLVLPGSSHQCYIKTFKRDFKRIFCPLQNETSDHCSCRYWFARRKSRHLSKPSPSFEKSWIWCIKVAIQIQTLWKVRQILTLIGGEWIIGDKETDFHNIRSYFAGKQIYFGMVSRTTINETWRKSHRNTCSSKACQ